MFFAGVGVVMIGADGASSADGCGVAAGGMGRGSSMMVNVLKQVGIWMRDDDTPLPP